MKIFDRWMTKKDEVIFLVDMTKEHMINCVNMLSRQEQRLEDEKGELQLMKVMFPPDNELRIAAEKRVRTNDARLKNIKIAIKSFKKELKTRE